MVTNHWIIHWEPDPPRTGSPNLSWLAFLNPPAEFSSRSISGMETGDFCSQQNVRAFRGIWFIWYGIPLMYTPGVFHSRAKQLRFSVQSSSVFSPPGLDMTQDRSDVRFSELPWQQHPVARWTATIHPGIVVVFSNGEGGCRTSAVQHGNL